MRSVLHLAVLGVPPRKHLVDRTQVRKVITASQSKSNNVWIYKHSLHWLHLEPTHQPRAIHSGRVIAAGGDAHDMLTLQCLHGL
jgi:hypothetical protein